jgi:hypothetical protein
VVDQDVAELAIGHMRKGLEKRYNFDEAWPLRCEAFAKVSSTSAASTSSPRFGPLGELLR